MMGVHAKWGTLKSWRLNDGGPAKAALRRFGLDADTVYLEWDGEHVSKEAAKEYVRGYDR